MKVLMITRGYPPVYDSGTFRPAAFARYLPDHGITPIVLCAKPESARVRAYVTDGQMPVDPRMPEPTRVDWPGETRGGRGFGRSQPGLHTWHRRRADRRFVEALLPDASRLIEEQQPDVVLTSCPPFQIALLADRLREQHGVPVVQDLRDPWSCFPWYTHVHRVDYELDRHRERRVLGRAAHVIANTPEAGAALTRLIGVDAGRVTVLPNGYDETDFTGLDEVEPLMPGCFVLAHTGMLWVTRGAMRRARRKLRSGIGRMFGYSYQPLRVDMTARWPVRLLEAVDRLLQRRAELRDVLRLVFVGTFNDDERELLEGFAHAGCIELWPAVSSRRAAEIACRSQLLLTQNFTMRDRRGDDRCLSVPSKLYTYLRTGRRILSLSRSPDVVNLIERFDAGVAIDAHDVDAIELALEREIDTWRQQGEVRRDVIDERLREYDRRNQTTRLAEILRRAAAG